MTNPHVLQTVRETLIRWLANRHPGEAFTARESILVRDGFYCGRRFDFGDYQAVWFVEEGMLKVYTAAGDLISRIVIQDQQDHQAVQPLRRAA
jgi:hypothetical protein